MSQYLHVSVGQFQLLIRTDQVIAVADGLNHTPSASGGHFQWQERALPISTLFDRWHRNDNDRQTFIVFGADLEDEHAFAMSVDEVHGTRSINDQALASVPPFNSDFGHIVDGAWLDPEQPDGHCLLRLRDPAVTLAPTGENAA